MHQMGPLDPIIDGCDRPCGYWELNSGPLEEQLVLLNAEQSLQPKIDNDLIAMCTTKW